jgi:pimaricinolide synthase PimS2
MKTQPAIAAIGTEPIAVIGMACRLPQAPSVESFWRLLQQGLGAITEAPAGRWEPRVDMSAPPGSATDSVRGGFLAQVDEFDAGFFGLSPAEAAALDPQLRLLLELSWEALDDAGVGPLSLRGSRTGVFLGAARQDYAQLLLQRWADGTPVPSQDLRSLPVRLAQTLDLRGPSLHYRSAGSASLGAVHEARRSLQRGECTLALAGGVSLLLLPPDQPAMGHPGPVAAAGALRGEGGGLVVLQPLSQAVAQGNPVRCILLGSALMQDGSADDSHVPDEEAQRHLLRAACTDAGVGPQDLQYVEFQGRVAAVDAGEEAALAALYATGRTDEPKLAMGSVTANLGDLEAAAGIAGFIKAVLALQHRQIPPNRLDAPGDSQTPSHTPEVQPATSPRPWPKTHGRAVAAVSALGANSCHVILAEADATAPDASQRAPTSPPSADAGPAAVLPLSAQRPEALRALARQWIDLLGHNAEAALPDLLYTASVRRSHLPHRLAAVARSASGFIPQLRSFLADQTHAGLSYLPEGPLARPQLVFVYSGQGGQWTAMGRELLADEPVFRQRIEECDRLLPDCGAFSLRAALQGEVPDAELERVDVIQPAVFAMQVGLSALWRSWGVEPGAVVGHSLGELAAAVAAGWLTLEQACRLVCLRSKLAHRLRGQGGMAVVELSRDAAAQALRDFGATSDLSIAAINGPHTVVLSGRPGELGALLADLQQKGVYWRWIKVDYASHSAQLDALKPELLAGIRGLRGRVGDIPMYSTVTGQWLREALNEEYWLASEREPVLFWPAIQALWGAGYNTFIELNPHPILLHSIREGLGQNAARLATIASMRRGERAGQGPRAALGSLYACGHEVDWRKQWPAGGRVVPLPPYPWQRERAWLEPSPTALETTETRAADESWYWTHKWQAAPAAARVPARQASLLLIADEHAVAAGLARWLAEQGAAVTLAASRAPEEWPLPGTAPAGGAAAYTDIVYLGGLDQPPEAQLGLAALEQIHRRDCSAVLHIVQTIDHAGLRDPPRLWLPTRGVHAVGAPPHALSPVGAVLWGLGRTVASEHPDLLCTRIDLPALPWDGELAALGSELLAADREEEVALCPRGRFVARIVGQDIHDATPAVASAATRAHTGRLLLRAEGTYLITGGLGGLGLTAARWLVDRGARHLVLVGRQGVVAPAQRGVLDGLQARGAQVVVAALDVAQRGQVAALLARIGAELPPLRGVIHAAGVVDDGLLLLQDWQRCARVLLPKIAGAWNLHELTRSQPIELFVLYSSVSALLGLPGQGAYAAANAFLDALAHYRRALGLPALSINWGMFAGVGLAAAGNGQRLIERGMKSLTLEQGDDALARLLASGLPQVGVMDLDPRQWLESYPQAAGSTLLASILHRARARRREDGAAAARAAALRAAPPRERRTQLATYVREQLGHVLRVDPAQLDDALPFTRLGVDSLMGLELKNRLESGLGLGLQATLLWTYPTIDQLAEYLSQQLGGAAPPAPPVAARTAAPHTLRMADLDRLTDSELLRLGEELLA